MRDGLFVHEVTRHEDVVHEATPEPELVSQQALDNEAAGLIQPSGAHVATQHAQAELASAALSCLLDRRLDERSSGSEASPVRVNSQPIDVQHVLARRERAGSTQPGVPDHEAVDHGDEHVVWARPLVEEGGADRWKGRGGDVVGPSGGVELPQNLLVPELSLSNRYHPDRMPQRRPSTKDQVPPYLGDPTCCRRGSAKEPEKWIQYPRVSAS